MVRRRNRGEGEWVDEYADRQAASGASRLPPPRPLSETATQHIRSNEERERALGALDQFKLENGYYKHSYDDSTLQTAKRIKARLYIFEVLTKSGLSLGDIQCQVEKNGGPAEGFSECTHVQALIDTLQKKSPAALNHKTFTIGLTPPQYDAAKGYWESYGMDRSHAGKVSRDSPSDSQISH